mmetsp:Transcript_19708/g.52647  ORF Transcript_19708/g.52647 Transcript_19708/m.52647 type:complete len:213 (+) Transcript_19708:175-813(+)
MSTVTVGKGDSTLENAALRFIHGVLEQKVRGNELTVRSRNHMVPGLLRITTACVGDHLYTGADRLTPVGFPSAAQAVVQEVLLATGTFATRTGGRGYAGEDTGAVRDLPLDGGALDGPVRDNPQGCVCCGRCMVAAKRAALPLRNASRSGSVVIIVTSKAPACVAASSIDAARSNLALARSRVGVVGGRPGDGSSPSGSPAAAASEKQQAML